MHRALSPVSYGHRTMVKERISEIDTFDQFPLLPIIKGSIASQALVGMEDISPTPVQRLAIPVLLGDDKNSHRRRSLRAKGEEMEQFLLAAETGSGKTLAYLLPILDAVKRAEIMDADLKAHNEALEEDKRKKRNPLELESPPLSNQPHPTTGRPRAIILVPTSELVSQVGNLTKKLSHTVKFRSALLSSAYTGRVIRNRLFSPGGIDVLISTPHLLASIAESDPNILSRVSHLVIDEADSLLDRSFAPMTSAIIDKSTPSLRQLILCSATIPRSLDSYLRTRFPSMSRLVTPNLHAIPRRVQLGVVDVDRDPYRGNRSLACADTIWSIGKAAAEQILPPPLPDFYPPPAPGMPDRFAAERVDLKRILVFVNEREQAAAVAAYLQSKGIDALALSRDTPEQRQAEILTAFTSANPESVAVRPSSAPPPPAPASISHPNSVPAARAAQTPASPPRRQLPNTKVLVATDLGSRGIDTLAVRHVILYDVPHSTIDFIHRLGRTGRMGRRGRGIVLVGKGDRKDVVREVREGMFRGQALI
ncbi:atp-dependent rna helicase [Lasallia pustulata]|uniref:RNA helicase n=2 Tax=Lasallia pustulata TaxID=136370 RepID=A0A1W5D884_9LECA|nr:atp-dependent rna helicase [Lasallia pustulata]